MPDFLPLQLLLVTFAGWVNRQQAGIIPYLPRTCRNAALAQAHTLRDAKWLE